MEAVGIAAAIGVELVGRLPHGEGTGAYEVRLTDGSSAVMKLFTGEFDLDISTVLTDALRAHGYPIPGVHATGVVSGVRYEIQEQLPGRPLERATSDRVGPIVELIQMQRDVGLPGRGPWVDTMIASVVHGCNGYCEHAAMIEHSDETRALLERLVRIADTARGVAVSEHDVVHYDFSPLNILASGDRISGVVDWDGATSGDVAFDLVTLAIYTYDYSVRDELLACAAALTDPRALALYAAHMVLRQVDWSLRHHGDEQVEWFMAIGADLLAAVGAE